MLTLPEFASPDDVLSVLVSSLDANLSVPYTVTPDQIAAWTDEELLAKVAALKAGVRGLLPVGCDLQVAVAWSRNARSTVLKESETVRAD